MIARLHFCEGANLLSTKRPMCELTIFSSWSLLWNLVSQWFIGTCTCISFIWLVSCSISPFHLKKGKKKFINDSLNSDGAGYSISNEHSKRVHAAESHPSPCQYTSSRKIKDWKVGGMLINLPAGGKRGLGNMVEVSRHE